MICVSFRQAALLHNRVLHLLRIALAAMALQHDDIINVDLDSTCVDEGLMKKHLVLETPSSASKFAALAPSGGSDGSQVSLSRAASLMSLQGAPNFRAFKVSAAVEKFMVNPGSSTATWFALICFLVLNTCKQNPDVVR